MSLWIMTMMMMVVMMTMTNMINCVAVCPQTAATHTALRVSPLQPPSNQAKISIPTMHWSIASPHKPGTNWFHVKTKSARHDQIACNAQMASSWQRSNATSATAYAARRLVESAG